MATWHRFVIEGDLELARSVLAPIPGPSLRARSLSCPANCAWLVSSELRTAGIEFRYFPDEMAIASQRARRAVAEREMPPLLRSWVPKFLTPYQREGITWAVGQGSGHLHHAGGAGKTVQEIIWGLSAPGKIVAVTKAAVREQWAREVERFTTVKPQILVGRDEGKRTEINPDARIYVLGYQTLGGFLDELKMLKPVSAIFDESQLAKAHSRWNATVLTEQEATAEEIANAGVDGRGALSPAVKFSLKDNITASAMRLSRMVQRRLAGTATPLGDRVRDLWAQLDLVHPREWGNFWAWAKRYCAATEGAFGGMDTTGNSNLQELSKRMDFVRHRVPFSVANRELPPRRRQIIYVRQSDQVRPDAIAAELRHAMKVGGTTLLEVKLQEAAARKRKVVTGYVGDAVRAGQKVCVFTGRRKDCDRLIEDFGKFGAPVFGGHGGHSVEHRQEQLDGYMKSPGPCILVGTIDAWGEGLNIQDTDLACLVMLPYTPKQIIQAEARWVRLGMKRPCLILYFIAEGTVDEHVAQILISKLPAVQSVIGADEIAGLSRELIGADDEELVNSLMNKIIGEVKA